MTYVPYDPNRPKQKPKDLNAQDVDTWKDAEAAKDRFIKQTQGASEEYSHIGPNPYSAKRAMPSTRQASTSTPKPTAKPVTSTKPRFKNETDMPKNTSIPVKAPVASKPDRALQDVLSKPVDQTSFLSKLKESDRASANSKYANTRDFKGDTSLDLSNPKSKSDAGPKAKPVVKAAPKVKSQFERMQDAYEGFGKGSDSAANKAIQSRIEGKGVATKKKGGSACKGYAKGGSVKSSASSRGDGCATKGHTKGAMR